MLSSRRYSLWEHSTDRSSDISQKHQQNECVTWSKQRKMTMQLACVSSLYLVGWSPCLIVGILQVFNSPTFFDQFQRDCFLDLIYLVCILLPWISIGLVPELSTSLRWYRRLGKTTNVVSVLTRVLLMKRTRINDPSHRISNNILINPSRTTAIHWH